MKHSKDNTSRGEHRSGTVTVEFALILPVALLIVFGLVEFARVNMIRNAMQNAAYEGARMAIIRGGSASNAEDRAKEFLQIISVNNAKIRVQPAVIKNDTPDVTIAISIPLAENLWLTPSYFIGKTISTNFTMTRESSQSGH